ncbi:hypothetical protein K491DRAFT_722771 [Lophiostoma macrostomum CBS 122681]|uniref:SRR1-like domain-containing protein n=1 Tax=Lophiostoma macrostomum CBS 122681 TaxID=1314788 RepID=A0A6A6SKR5_9PLEO|nr:hypothetical protein K491DRAFT_722771 [Lophiostoma macrostomum CBS 122681]
MANLGQGSERATGFLRTTADIKHSIEWHAKFGFPLPIVAGHPDKPIFTRRHLEVALEEFKKIPSRGGTWKYQVLDMNGSMANCSIKLAPLKKRERKSRNNREVTFISKPHVDYRPWVHVSKKYLELFDDKNNKTPIVFSKRPRVVDEECNCGWLSDTIQEASEAWEDLPYHNALVSYLLEHSDEMEQVDQIICFGHGPLCEFRSQVQHLAASTIRRVLLAKHKMSSTGFEKEIKIYAQDPAYCNNCKTLLKKQYNIEVLDDHDGFLQLNKNSFVVSIAPDVPVRQIAVDMTFDEGGPAGMLCTKIRDESKEEVTMLDFADPWSPRLEAYKKKCIVGNMNHVNSDADGSYYFGSTELYFKKRTTSSPSTGTGSSIENIAQLNLSAN